MSRGGAKSGAGGKPGAAGGQAGKLGFRSPVGCTGVTPGEAEFVDWCKEEKVRFPSSRLAVLPATGRALVAARNIKMGEVVVEVPDDAVLMAENCSIREVLEEEGMTKDSADEEILEVQGLILAVMVEKARGAGSRWAPYLALLPADMTHMPLYWKRNEFRELRGTAAYDKMLGRAQHPSDAPTQVPLLWSEVAAPFIAEHPELGLPGGERGYELYRWATSAVASYSFILGDDKYQAMVPVWDLLNHITGEVNVRLHHCRKRHVLQMIAMRDIAAGAELVNNYGELSNAELLRGYGFVERANRYNHVQVPVGFVARAAREQMLQEVLEDLQDEDDDLDGMGEDDEGEGEDEEGEEEEQDEEEEASGEEDGAGRGPGSAGGEEAAEAAAAIRRGVASRLRLATQLGLMPQHHVFKVFAGRPPPAALTALIYLLLSTDEEAAAVRRAGRAADAAAKKALAAAGGGRKRKASAADEAVIVKAVAAAGLDTIAAALAADLGEEEAAQANGTRGAKKRKGAAGDAQDEGSSDEEEEAEDDDDEDAGGEGGDGEVAGRVAAVYGRILDRMLGRYVTSLDQDEQLMKQYDSLPPRRRAALLARLPEKQALASLQRLLAAEGGGALAASLAARDAAAAGAAGKTAAGAGSGGGGGGSSDGGSSDEGEEQGQGKVGKGRKKQKAQGQGGAGAPAGPQKQAGAPQDAKFSFGFAL
ncbi:hypothetical protein HXX76_003034 [Chlamydomonas incerta]|uniref:SET domain-containing protein n=1 Tax=Chlamydomonas incerta TaxID=51695 RepID=A0A835W814_CHLIN|nr:hypothetical protein HXX76_003034 [Chlamydomonas incerta]|eukprot:KAG2442960.1 hypothetical protein HXX76_003034 [Chlamydomonas incerta]